MRRIRMNARLILFTALIAAAAFSPRNSSHAKEETWAIYWYVCGADLESDSGFATNDFREACQVSLPENVKLVIQTGGAKKWDNSTVDAKALYRLTQSGNTFEVVQRAPQASMGDPQTLYDFLEFCGKNYPADRKALILWDHGGGSDGGICYDELYDQESLTFEDLKEVFSELYDDSPDKKPFELIGFDACLMATLDMAGLVAPYAEYMVASEETEPGVGWKYDGILGALAKNPGMDGAELGRVICDTYYEGCREEELEENVTLSTIDLSKMDYLNLAMSYLAYDTYMSLQELDPSKFFAEFSRGAKKADTYGRRAKKVDLLSLTRVSAKLFPNASKMVADAVKECVVYQKVGPYRKNSNGISVFFPSAEDKDSFGEYEKSSEAGGDKISLFPVRAADVRRHVR